MIPNVIWSDPASYSYAFIGIPKHSVIAINCTGIKGNHPPYHPCEDGHPVRVINKNGKSESDTYHVDSEKPKILEKVRNYGN